MEVQLQWHLINKLFVEDIGYANKPTVIAYK